MGAGDWGVAGPWSSALCQVRPSFMVKLCCQQLCIAARAPACGDGPTQSAVQSATAHVLIVKPQTCTAGCAERKPMFQRQHLSPLHPQSLQRRVRLVAQGAAGVQRGGLGSHSSMHGGRAVRSPFGTRRGGHAQPAVRTPAGRRRPPRPQGGGFLAVKDSLTQTRERSLFHSYQPCSASS